MYGACKLDLLGCQIAIWIVGKLLAKHKNAVEGSAQLMRHVGEELRFVLGGEGKFLGLLFQSAPRLLDFAVLAFHLDVLFGKLLRLESQLFVRLLQFLLLGL